MAGTYSEQATLASDNAFIAKVKVAMIKRAIEFYNSGTPQEYKVLEQSRRIINNAGSEAASIAALVVSAISTISAAAPAVPSDVDTQAGVNTVLTALLK